MFRALSAHLQEDTIVYMQHMVLSQFVVACRYTAVHYHCVTIAYSIQYSNMLYRFVAWEQ